MNNITLHGRLTGDPENKTGQDGKPIAHFSVADNHGKDNQGNDKVSFFRCSAFGKSAELILGNVKKGHLICVIGRLETHKYTDNAGVQQTSLDVTVDRFGFCDSGTAPNTQPAMQTQSPTGHPAPGYGVPAPGYGYPPAGVPAPAPGYGPAPVPGYGVPAPGYGYGPAPAPAPAPGYGPAPAGYPAPPPAGAPTGRPF